MGVYTDKRNGRRFIKFDHEDETYKRYLPDGIIKTEGKAIEKKWRADLFLETFGIKKERTILYEDFLADHFLPFAENHYSEDGFKNVLHSYHESLLFLKGTDLKSITVVDIEKFEK